MPILRHTSPTRVPLSACWSANAISQPPFQDRDWPVSLFQNGLTFREEAKLGFSPGPGSAMNDRRGAARDGCMRLIVTGGAGFIGSAAVCRAVGAGHEVLTIDKLTYASNLESLSAVM